MTDEAHADLILRIRAEAKQRQVRWTKQRQLIVEAFISTDRHLSVEDLHHLVQETDPGVSAATVYRTVNLLVDIGVAQKRNFNESSASFECVINKEHHDHLINVENGEVIEFHCEEIEELQREIAKRHGLRLVDHRLELFAVPLEVPAKLDGSSSVT